MYFWGVMLNTPNKLQRSDFWTHYRYIFIHLVVCLTTGPKPLPKRTLHVVRARDSSFKWEYPLISLSSSSSFLRLFPRLPATSIPPFIFLSITRCRRQVLCKMWPIQLAFRLLISFYIYLYYSLVFSLRGRVGRNQSPILWPVWLWHTASWASSWR